MDGYLTEPVTSVKLQAALERWTSSRPGGAGTTAEHALGGDGGGVLDASLTFGARQPGEFTGENEQFVVGGRIEEAEVRCADVASVMEVASKALTAALRTQA